jgi:hypothetical protein
VESLVLCTTLWSTTSKLLLLNRFSVLGTEVKEKINSHIVRKYLGEQPVGSAFIIKNSGNSLKYRYIIVVALFRAVTCRGDDMAWLDPCYLPMDYAYSAMRGVLLRVFQHNAVSPFNNKIKTIYCPDFWKVNYRV